jgi:adenylyltransferase/sulfurtransferase
LQVAANVAELSKDEILRYSRHLIMPEVGMEGQLKLKEASVLLVGAGGLGAPLAMYLTAAGIGRIGLVDFDVVDFTNLQRQVIHGTKDVGKKKIDSAFESMRDINPFVTLERHETALSSENAFEIFKNYDYVVDGTDNFPTRYLVNDACRPRAQLRRRRSARHPARRHRPHPGHGNREADPGHRPAAHRTPSPLRRPRHEIPRT